MMLSKPLTVLLAGLLSGSTAPPAPSSAPAHLIVNQRTNPPGHTLEIARHTVFTGDFVNHGTFKTTDTTVSFTGTYTEAGSYISDPSTNYFTDLIVGPSGTLTGGLGDCFVVSGSFFNASTGNLTWNTGAAELAFSPGSSHAMSLPGADRGPVFAGTINNYAWGLLRLASGQTLTLSDANAVPGAAFYAEKLILEGGLPQIPAITGNGSNIYYNPFDTANAWLGGLTYPLAGGGSIIPMGATVQFTATVLLPNGHQVLHVLGAPGHAHTVRFSPDLTAPFTFLATVTAAPDGTFSYEDSSATNISRRFYQVTFP